jgi:hypothetical protein
MKKLFGVCVVLLALMGPVLAQDDEHHRDRDDDRQESRHDWRGRLSAEDQERFDSYYSRWVGYRRDNNHEQIESMEKRMREVMDRNHIPRDVPFDQIASGGDRDHDRGRRGDDYRGRLSSEDQEHFDSYYSRWLEYRRSNDRDQIESMEKRMQEVMARNRIPPEVPFDEIASRR